MTEQETLEYNKRCAEFLGVKCSVNEQYELPKMMTFSPKEASNLCHTAKVCCVDDMQFHSDWNWIMEVVEAIEKLGFQFNIYHEDCLIEKDKKFIVVTHATKVKTKKEAVVRAIDQFLVWYEQNK